MAIQLIKNIKPGLVFLFLFNCLLIYGQKKGLNPEKDLTQYNLNIWGNSDGLPSQGANNILQHQDGYLWISTFNGLVKFDGRSISTIPIFDTTANLIGNSFKRLYQDTENTLWVSSNGSGLLSLKDNALSIFTKENGLPSNIVNDILKDRNGKLWVGTASGLTFKKEFEFTQEGVKQPLTQSGINRIIQDSAGNIWIATQEKGVFKLTEEGEVLENFPLANKQALELEQDHVGNIWIGTNKGIVIISPQNRIFSFGPQHELPGLIIKAIYEDQDKGIWIGTNKGLCRFYNNELQVLVEKSQIPNHDVTNIIEDNEGNLWVSTYQSGFYQLTEGKFTTYTINQGLTGNHVYSIVESDTGQYLVATNAGISQFKPGWDWHPFLVDGKPFNKRVRDLFIDSKGNTWFCTENTLFCMENGGKLKKYSTKDGLSHAYVRTIFEDKEGNMWFGTEDGLNKFSDGEFVPILAEGELSSQKIHAINQDSEGTIWISTEEGLNSLKDGKITSYTSKDGLSGNVIFQIYEDEDEVLWIGTNGGITRYKNNEFISINRANNFPIHSAFDFLEDEENNLWIPCNGGILRVPKSELNAVADGEIKKITSFRIFNKDDGMKANAATANARSLISTNGSFWIATPNGVTLIENPLEISLNKQAPKIIIESISVDNKNVPIKSPIVIPPGNHRINIKFTALSFKAPKRVTFAYALEPEYHMQKIGSQREVSFNNLHPDTYNFTVMAFNNDDFYHQTELVIIKQPYFYQKTLFQLLAPFLVLIFLMLVTKWNSRRVRKQNEFLEQTVQERTEEIHIQKEQIDKQRKSIERKNKELGRKNSELIDLNEEKNQLIGIVAHDLKSPLGQIYGLINLIKMDGDNLTEEQKMYFDHIFNSANRLNGMISHILNVESIESKSFNFSMEVINLYYTLLDVSNDYTPDLNRKQLKLEFSPEKPQDFLVETDAKIVVQVFANLLSNAIKFSPPEKKIFVSISTAEKGKVRVEIKDEGPGITKEDMKKLFGKYQRLSAKPTGGEKSTGLGLAIAKKYVEALKGKIWCESQEGKGASFIVEFPLAKSKKKKQKAEETKT
ncbi:two-component regulator propeller domain-containing protein [Flexithrix dorotheae]|uniref:sensor histidine kinase n=1 Tax=Flexithrix dorotheae TaxID=70993 RepID=UPI00036871A1|nr:two-component regulator propeller domain-containing protein [Flexithrix dorotheae]